MSAFALHESGDRDGAFRWGASAALILAAHAALIAAATVWYRQAEPPGIALPMVMIDLAPPAPKPSMPETKPADVPPPEPQPQTLLPPEPPPPPPPLREEAVQEPPAPAPLEAQPIPQPSPTPEPKIEPLPSKPEPATALPEQAKPAPVKPAAPKAKPVTTESKKPVVAPHRALPSERPASAASAPQGVPNPEAMAAYNRRVAAHLQGFRPPPVAGQQGVSRLSFTLGRNGQVLSSRLSGSSGHPALDSEALAMVRRAQPFPPIPAELKQASISFSVPIAFR